MAKLTYTLDPDERSVTVQLIPDSSPPTNGGKIMLTKESIRGALQPWIPVLGPITFAIPGRLDDLLLRLVILILNDDQFLDTLIATLNSLGISSLAQLQQATNAQVLQALQQAMVQYQHAVSRQP